MQSISLKKITPTRVVMLLSCVLSLGLFSQASIAVGGPHSSYSITILHTNDFHSRFRPISKTENFCSADANKEGKCFGGTARLITAIEDARLRHSNTILLDGGDQFQGTFFFNFYKGKVAAEMMNKLGYEGMTIGNHEFDDGPETLRKFIDEVTFPVLVANVDVSLEPALQGKLQKSIIIEKNNQKIGLIGVVTEKHVVLSRNGNIVFTDALSAVQSEVDSLIARGVNKIILMSHISYALDKMIAANTTGIDVIVGGHSDTYLSNFSDKANGPYPTVVNGTQIVHAYAHGKYLGELTVLFDEQGNVFSARGEPIIIDGSINENAAIVARLDELEEPITNLKETLIGNISNLLNRNREACHVQECNLENIIADLKTLGIQWMR